MKITAPYFYYCRGGELAPSGADPASPPGQLLLPEEQELQDPPHHLHHLLLPLLAALPGSLFSPVIIFWGEF